MLCVSRESVVVKAYRIEKEVQSDKLWVYLQNYIAEIGRQ